VSRILCYSDRATGSQPLSASHVAPAGFYRWFTATGMLPPVRYGRILPGDVKTFDNYRKEVARELVPSDGVHQFPNQDDLP
jgi:hypothetical protein